MHSKRGMTLPEIITMIVIAAILLVVFMPAVGTSCHPTSNQTRDAMKLRGIHMADIIFANSNGSYLPGLNATGVPLDSTDVAFSSLTGHNTGVPGLGGTAMNTRLYILLNGDFLNSDMIKPDPLTNPVDKPAMTRWNDKKFLPRVPTVTDPGQFSFSLLNIADAANAGTVASQTSPGRVGEWRDNANSQAILMVDRNTASNTLSPRSVWATRPGNGTDWLGNVVWGDNHSDYLLSHRDNLTTRYLTNVTTNDSLFQNETDPGTTSDHDNAFFNWTSANY